MARQKELIDRTATDLIVSALRALILAGKGPTAALIAAELGLGLSAVRSRLASLVAENKIRQLQGPGRTRLYVPAEHVEPILSSVDAPSNPPTSQGGTSTSEDASPEKQQRGQFEARDLDRMVIAPPLADAMRDIDSGKDVSGRVRVVGEKLSVVIDVNTHYLGGRQRAKSRIFDLLVCVALPSVGQGHARNGTLDIVSPVGLRNISEQYVFALLDTDQIRALVRLDTARDRSHRAIYRIWPDHLVQTFTVKSLSTIKADAARATFGCLGKGIVWAVVDSGIDGNHPHFRKHKNLEDLPEGVQHIDLSALGDPGRNGDPIHGDPLEDQFGHGTHVAGIIAGALDGKDSASPLTAIIHSRNENDAQEISKINLPKMSGVAPECKLVSYKVLNDKGQGGVIGVIAALEEIERVNSYGKSIRIHGVNLSLGYPFDPRWFACGHSPLCEVVDRLVRSGVFVVAAAGNSGFGYVDTVLAGSWAQGLPMSINDPGNADRAITVGSSHREAPHKYGVSYFSSKGPTGDGRTKPDLLAPGEKIISCRSTSVGKSGKSAADIPLKNDDPLYKEDSGTSMAAPHVSGAIAAFLSVRQEFRGRTDEVKELLLRSAVDLKRERYSQGAGMLDLLRALQSV